MMKFGMMTHIPLYSRPTVKISNFWKSKKATAAILKITQIALPPQPFDWSVRNFVWWRKMGLLTSTTVKIFQFHKSKMADGRHFENSKIAISLQSFDRFEGIWYGNAYWPFTEARPLKFQIFENPRWPRRPSWKSQKSRYLPCSLTERKVT